MYVIFNLIDHGRSKRFVVFRRVAIISFESINQIYYWVLSHFYLPRKDGLAGATGNTIQIRSSNCSGMFYWIIEIITCNHLSCHFVTTIAKSISSHHAHFRTLENSLLSIPSGIQSITYSWILIEIKTLFHFIVYYLRCSQTMEIVDYQYGMASFRIVESSQCLRRKTFSTFVQCGHFEAIHLTRFQFDLAGSSSDNLSIIEATSSFCYIQYIRGRSCSRFCFIRLRTP